MTSYVSCYDIFWHGYDSGITYYDAGCQEKGYWNLTEHPNNYNCVWERQNSDILQVSKLCDNSSLTVSSLLGLAMNVVWDKYEKEPHRVHIAMLFHPVVCAFCSMSDEHSYILYYEHCETLTHLWCPVCMLTALGVWFQYRSKLGIVRSSHFNSVKIIVL
jgi:hypothetical protein